MQSEPELDLHAQVTTIIGPAVLAVFVLNLQISFLDAATGLFGFYLAGQIEVRGAFLLGVRALVPSCVHSLVHVSFPAYTHCEGAQPLHALSTFHVVVCGTRSRTGHAWHSACFSTVGAFACCAMRTIACLNGSRGYAYL